MAANPLRNALAKFCAPVPWLLEAPIVLELALHKYYDAAVIAALLIFNAALAYFQEGPTQATLAALKSRLALNASVERDGAWKTVAATEFGESWGMTPARFSRPELESRALAARKAGVYWPQARTAVLEFF
jgi:hypothetical protein